MTSRGDEPYDFERRGWTEAQPGSAIIIPIYADSEALAPIAMLVSGINALGRWDERMATFYHLLSRHIASGIMAATRAEQDAKRFVVFQPFDPRFQLMELTTGQKNLSHSIVPKPISVRIHKTPLLSYVTDARVRIVSNSMYISRWLQIYKMI